MDMTRDLFARRSTASMVFFIIILIYFALKGIYEPYIITYNTVL